MGIAEQSSCTEHCTNRCCEAPLIADETIRPQGAGGIEVAVVDVVVVVAVLVVVIVVVVVVVVLVVLVVVAVVVCGAHGPSSDIDLSPHRLRAFRRLRGLSYDAKREARVYDVESFICTSSPGEGRVDGDDNLCGRPCSVGSKLFNTAPNKGMTILVSPP